MVCGVEKCATVCLGCVGVVVLWDKLNGPSGNDAGFGICSLVVRVNCSFLRAKERKCDSLFSKCELLHSLFKYRAKSE